MSFTRPRKTFVFFRPETQTTHFPRIFLRSNSEVSVFLSPISCGSHSARICNAPRTQRFQKNYEYSRQEGATGLHFFQSCRIFARMPDRLEAPVLNITDRKKAFAVFGLMSIRLAIWLVVYPCIRSSRASFSRSVRRNFRAARNRSGCSRSLSNKTAKVAPEWFCKLDFSANNRTW